MENLVNKIIDIDHQADDLLKAAQEEREKDIQQIEEEKRRIMDELDKKGEEKLRGFEQAQKKSAEDEIKKIHVEQKKEEEALQKEYQEHSKTWVKQLVDQCLQS